MTKAFHDGLGRTQRRILYWLAVGDYAQDAESLAELIYGGRRRATYRATAAQYSGVRRALKQLQRAGKVGKLDRNNQGRLLWVTAEQLAKRIAADEIACALCHENLRDEHYAYRLENGDCVHGTCWSNQRDDNGKLINRGKEEPRSFRYHNHLRKLNGMSVPPAVASKTQAKPA
jgi:hypothetical protein